MSGPADPKTAGPMIGPVIGLDLGGTKISAGLVDPDGTVRCGGSAPTPAQDGPEAILAAMTALAADIAAAAESAGTPATGLGVGAAGVIDPVTGSVTAATDHLAGWTGTPVAARLAAATGLPVRVVNDVHAHALGESLLGAGAGLSTVLVVAAGTGLGGALVIDGRVLTGTRGVAGHLGHVPAAEAAGLPCSCGGTGHLECVSSGAGLLLRYRERIGSRQAGHRISGRIRSGADVARAAAAGDDDARACLRVSATALGRAIGGWINTLDPDAVVVTGGLAQAGDPDGLGWWADLRHAVAAETVPAAADCAVLPATLGARAALVGAASLLRGPGGPHLREDDA